MRITEYAVNRGCSALLNTAERFVLQGGDSARLVAGGWVFIDGLTVAREVVLETVDHIHGLVKEFFCSAAVHQNGLSAEHLGHFGENRCAAFGDEHITECTNSGICRDTGKSVRSTAL